MSFLILPQRADMPGRERVRIGFESIAERVFMRRAPRLPVVMKAHRQGLKLPRVSRK